MSAKTDIEKFTVWLIGCGAEVLPGTNPYEVLRCSTKFGISVVYRNKRGEIAWPSEFREVIAAYRNGRKINVCPSLKKRTRNQSIIDRIIKRDGLVCWFSGHKFLSPCDPEISIEHLCPVAHGGPNHLSNLVIATREWNKKAGHLSVSEKVRMRDFARATYQERDAA